MLRFAGVILLVLGFFSALALLAQPMMFAGFSASVLLLWSMFIVCYGAGATLLVVGMRGESAAKTLRIASAVLVVIGLMAAIAVFAGAVDIIALSATISLWILFLVSMVVGVIGMMIAGLIQRQLAEEQTKASA